MNLMFLMGNLRLNFFDAISPWRADTLSFYWIYTFAWRETFLSIYECFTSSLFLFQKFWYRIVSHLHWSYMVENAFSSLFCFWFDLHHVFRIVLLIIFMCIRFENMVFNSREMCTHWNAINYIRGLFFTDEAIVFSSALISPRFLSFQLNQWESCHQNCCV